MLAARAVFDLRLSCICRYNAARTVPGQAIERARWFLKVAPERVMLSRHPLWDVDFVDFDRQAMVMAFAFF